MKNIKPIYIYAAGIILAVIVFFLVSQQDSTGVSVPQNGISNKEMPQDSIHKSLMGTQPGKNNVMDAVKQHLEMLKKDVAGNPNDTVKIKQYADFLAAAHQPDEAVKYYNKILKINPKRVDILFSVAYINYVSQNFTEAEKTLNKVISIDKNNLQAYYNLGAIAVSKGDKAKAKEIWSKLIKEHPKDQVSQLAKKSLSEI